MAVRAQDWILALAAGGMLALLIDFNGEVAGYASPTISSWVAHGIGSIAALLLVIGAMFFSKAPSKTKTRGHIPWWAWLGGIPGGITVALAGVTVISEVGVSGTITLGLVGQVLFGMVCDHFGWLGVPKKPFKVRDIYVVLCVLAGTCLIVFAG
ncbi:DMT family transporter [Pelagibaculum spongiae]|uniref:EamA-like transporter family protein n=1 Tax=Pelagibaculum spongiae TaxID=2080658 RepID=A0A2V1GVD4_9GAMM|nr:DMT family transporter [Pelagibaculum spongiae]PVZ68301.1 hypothetical protein DC094_13515 [Pelagibaculum spongiae]